jgi:oligopeptide transport system permease protein
MIRRAGLWQRLPGNRTVVLCLVALGAVVIVALLGPWLSPNDYQSTDFDFVLHCPTWTGWHVFGTDELGRDLFVRTMFGIRVTITVALVASAVSLLIGVLYGAVAGYAGGWIDAVMMRFVDTLYAMPFIFFVILLMVAFGRNFVLIFVAIGAINWLDMARIVRGQTLSLREREFVEAARVSGVSAPRIILRHIAPNLMGIVIVSASRNRRLRSARSSGAACNRWRARCTCC